MLRHLPMSKIALPVTLVRCLLASAAWVLPLTVSAETNPPSPVVEATEEDKAFAAFVEDSARLAMGTPGQEAANSIATGWRRDLILRLKGEKPADAGGMEFARRHVRELLVNITNGPAWPRPALVRIPLAATPPAVDGRLDDPAWQRAAVFKVLYAFNTTLLTNAPATTCRALWASNALYFAFECDDSDIVAPELKRDDTVFFHDCVELFILPEFRLGAYWELVISPTRSVYDALNAKRFTDWGCDARPTEDIAGLTLATVVKGSPNDSSDQDTSYAIEVAVPFRELPSYTRGNPPAPGDRLHLMLVRLDKTGKTLKAFSAVPLIYWGHNIWNHIPVELTVD